MQSYNEFYHGEEPDGSKAGQYNPFKGKEDLSTPSSTNFHNVASNISQTLAFFRHQIIKKDIDTDNDITVCREIVKRLETFFSTLDKLFETYLDLLEKQVEVENNIYVCLGEEGCKQDIPELKQSFGRLQDVLKKKGSNSSTHQLPSLRKGKSFVYTFLTKVLPDVRESLNCCEQTMISENFHLKRIEELETRLQNNEFRIWETPDSVKSEVEKSKKQAKEYRERFETQKVQVCDKLILLEGNRVKELQTMLDSLIMSFQNMSNPDANKYG